MNKNEALKQLSVAKNAITEYAIRRFQGKRIKLMEIDIVIERVNRCIIKAEKALK